MVVGERGGTLVGDRYARDLYAEHRTGDPGDPEHRDGAGRGRAVPDHEAGQAQDRQCHEDERADRDGHGHDHGHDRTRPNDRRTTSTASTSRFPSSAGWNGRSNASWKPMSRSFRMVSRPSATPTSTAATRLALSGRTSTRATPTSPSTGMRRNAPGVRSLRDR